MNVARYKDESAGDVDYGEIGGSYRRFRQPEPAIAAQILDALEGARTVLNVGAGAGSYEPTDRKVTAVEPSAAMRAQRLANLSIAVNAVAEDLPFENASFDASMATVTVHQWSDLERGLAEMRRVTRGPVVIFIADPDLMQDYWLKDYIPEVRTIEASRFPPLGRIATALRGHVEVKPVRFRSTAATASTRPIMAARRHFSTRKRGWPARAGAWFPRRQLNALSVICRVILQVGIGMKSMATCVRNPSSMDLCAFLSAGPISGPVSASGVSLAADGRIWAAMLDRHPPCPRDATTQTQTFSSLRPSQYRTFVHLWLMARIGK